MDRYEELQRIYSKVRYPLESKLLSDIIANNDPFIKGRIDEDFNIIPDWKDSRAWAITMEKVECITDSYIDIESIKLLKLRGKMHLCQELIHADPSFTFEIENVKRDGKIYLKFIYSTAELKVALDRTDWLNSIDMARLVKNSCMENFYNKDLENAAREKAKELHPIMNQAFGKNWSEETTQAAVLGAMRSNDYIDGMPTEQFAVFVNRFG